MSILTQVCEKMREKLQTSADQASLDCRFVARKRKLTGSGFAQTVVFLMCKRAVLRSFTSPMVSSGIAKRKRRFSHYPPEVCVWWTSAIFPLMRLKNLPPSMSFG